MKEIINFIREFQRQVLDFLVGRFYEPALKRRAEGITKLFEHLLGGPCRILDLGGGWGFYEEPLKVRGHESLVLDVIKPGYQKSPVVIYNGGRLPFEDKSFDLTILVTMLHHVPDPDALLVEVKRVTKQKVVVVEDLYHHGWGRFWTILRDRLLNMEFLNHPHQFRRHEEWLRFFCGKGFRLHYFKQFYTWLSGFRILNGVYVWECS